MSYDDGNEETGSRIWMLRDPERSGRNAMTVCVSVRPGAAPSHGRYSAKDMFTSKYPVIRMLLARHADQRGVLVLAFDEGAEPLAQAWVAATEERVRSVVLGRHSHCPLHVPPTCPAVALRHIAVLVTATDGRPRTRLVDLHTGTGFADEAGRNVRSVIVDGPAAFFSLHGLALLVLETGGGMPLASGEEAYEALPERHFASEEHAGIWPVIRPRRGEETWIQSVHGPVSSADPLLEGEPPVAALTFEAETSVPMSRPLGLTALRRGILVGRYDRCQVRVGDASHRLSRVHLLVIEHDGHRVAVDTASSNGTHSEGIPITSMRLYDGCELEAADLTLRWSELR